MKISLEELRRIVMEAVNEASERKKKEKNELLEPVENSAGYKPAEALDFSKPLGDANVLKRQGVANFGPYTEEKAFQKALQKMVEESLPQEECQHIFSTAGGTIWESAYSLFEATCDKCGAAMDEKKIGFAKLKGKLAHKKGVKNPAALAAFIGRKKYGAKGMAKKAAAGRRK